MFLLPVKTVHKYKHCHIKQSNERVQSDTAIAHSHTSKLYINKYHNEMSS